jgi:hypothetical protein
MDAKIALSVTGRSEARIATAFGTNQQMRSLRHPSPEAVIPRPADVADTHHIPPLGGLVIGGFPPCLTASFAPRRRPRILGAANDGVQGDLGYARSRCTVP